MKVGNLIIVAAPSGGGKTTLVHTLAQNLTNIAISVSYTTRAKRPNEIDGIDYFFIGEQQFLKMIEKQTFLEYAKVFNHYYGTSAAQIKSKLALEYDVVLDIDWQGAQQIKRIFPDAVTIFIIPPSLEILKQRLIMRRQDHKAVVTKRMEQAQIEMSHYADFDYLIVNDDYNIAARELQSIVIANRLTLKRQVQQQKELLSFLLS